MFVTFCLASAETQLFDAMGSTIALEQNAMVFTNLSHWQSTLKFVVLTVVADIVNRDYNCPFDFAFCYS
jgi:hypothetical protein